MNNTFTRGISPIIRGTMRNNKHKKDFVQHKSLLLCAQNSKRVWILGKHTLNNPSNHAL